MGLEERLALLREHGVELDDGQLDAIAGGARVHGRKDDCPAGGRHEWQKTGNKRLGSVMGIFDDVEYRCENCGKTEWRW